MKVKDYIEKKSLFHLANCQRLEYLIITGYVKIGSHHADVNVTYSDLYIIQNTNRITDAQISY